MPPVTSTVASAGNGSPRPAALTRTSRGAWRTPSLTRVHASSDVGNRTESGVSTTAKRPGCSAAAVRVRPAAPSPPGSGWTARVSRPSARFDQAWSRGRTSAGVVPAGQRTVRGAGRSVCAPARSTGMAPIDGTGAHSRRYRGSAGAVRSSGRKPRRSAVSTGAPSGVVTTSLTASGPAGVRRARTAWASVACTVTPCQSKGRAGLPSAVARACRTESSSAGCTPKPRTSPSVDASARISSPCRQARANPRKAGP